MVEAFFADRDLAPSTRRSRKLLILARSNATCLLLDGVVIAGLGRVRSELSVERRPGEPHGLGRGFAERRHVIQAVDGITDRNQLAVLTLHVPYSPMRIRQDRNPTVPRLFPIRRLGNRKHWQGREGAGGRVHELIQPRSGALNPASPPPSVSAAPAA